MEPDNKTPESITTHGTLGGENKIVQTYAQDMVGVIEEDRGGLIKKIIHSEEEHEIEKGNLSPESKKNKFFMFLGLVLILIASITLFFILFKRNIPTVDVQKQFIPIIFTDKSALVEVADLKKYEIEKKILGEINTTTLKPRGVEGVYLTFNKDPVGLRKFIEILGGNLTFVGNNFIDDNFLMGVVKNNSQNETDGFFILLKARSVADIFNPMRVWENKMFFDLNGFFGIDISPDTKYLLTANFEDGIVENKNARILYDKNGKIVMMYIFADDTSVIITNTNESAREIILRLASSQIKK